MPEFPPPPSAEEVTGHFALIGPTKHDSQVCYRIIDRRTTTGDAYRFPGKEAEYTERTRVVMMMLADPGDYVQGVAETMFAEFKRRLLYLAQKKWETEVAIRPKQEG